MNIRPNEVYGINLEYTTNKPALFHCGSTNLFHAMCGNTKPLYLPESDDTHALLGNWFLEGKDISTILLEPMKKVAIPTNAWNNNVIYFLTPKGFEPVIEQNHFNHAVTFYFRETSKLSAYK